MEKVGLGSGPIIPGCEVIGNRVLFPISYRQSGSRGIMFGGGNLLWSNVISRKQRTGKFEIKEEDYYYMGYTNPDIKDYDVYCKFDINKHKEKYIDYLEVIILEDGIVEYAVPSHQMKLLEIAMKKLGKNQEEILEMCPKERYGDFNEWICEISDCLCVWHWFHMGKCNQAQYETMQKLTDYKLYRGEIHMKEENNHGIQ